MEPKTRRLALVAVLTLLVSVACGNPDVGITSEEILVGTWTPLTGPASNLSTIAKGMEAYFAYVNEEEGGVHGRKLNLLIKDDGYDPARTPAVVEELVEGVRVFALLGGNGTANCLAVKDYIAIKLLPWINPGSGARVWTSPMNAYVFSTYPSYVTEGRILAKYVTDELQAEKYGMFYQDDSFGREGQEGVRLGLRNSDNEIAVAEAYTVGNNDLAEVAQKFKDEEVDVIFVWTITEGAAALVNAIEALGDYDPQIVATQVLADPVMFHLTGESWDGAIVASSVPETNSNEPGVVKGRQIIEKYGDGIEFGTYAMLGLARAEVMVEGLRRAGPDLNRLKLILALEGIKDWSDNFLGTPISFSAENHQGLNSVHLSKAEGGRLVQLSDWIES
jgi:ABC-type branched-subunit amino acid transport system substrate-binding protein